jgi:large-conductance mechanosensitive channel
LIDWVNYLSVPIIILTLFLFLLIVEIITRRKQRESFKRYEEITKKSEERIEQSIFNQKEMIVLLREIRDLLKNR